MLRFQIPIRLLAAFLCGWLFAFLDVFNYLVNFLAYLVALAAPMYNSVGVADFLVLLLALLFPLALGVTATLTVDRRNEHLISLALGTGLLALTGWYLYWLPGVVRADDELEASCHSMNPSLACNHGPISPESHFGTTLLMFSWLAGVVLVLVSSLITSLIIMKHRREEGHSRK